MCVCVCVCVCVRACQGRRKQLAFGTAECSFVYVPTVLYNVLSPSDNVMESHMYEVSIRIDIHNAIIDKLYALIELFQVSKQT